MKKHKLDMYLLAGCGWTLEIPMDNKHYRLYSSRRANAYKKYHAKVRKSIDNDNLFSLPSHKAWLTREKDHIAYLYKRDIIKYCNELLNK
jgi:hypothetical protein